jgi:hypothetical protein
MTRLSMIPRLNDRIVNDSYAQDCHCLLRVMHKNKQGDALLLLTKEVLTSAGAAVCS